MGRRDNLSGSISAQMGLEIIQEVYVGFGGYAWFDKVSYVPNPLPDHYFTAKSLEEIRHDDPFSLKPHLPILLRTSELNL